MGEAFLIALICGLLFAMRRQHKRAMRARELRRVAENSQQEATEKEAKRIATRDGYYWGHTFKVLEPDVDDESEVLFRGRYKGDDRAKIPADTDEDYYRAIVRGDGTGFVLTGW